MKNSIKDHLTVEKLPAKFCSQNVPSFVVLTHCAAGKQISCSRQNLVATKIVFACMQVLQTLTVAQSQAFCEFC